MKEKKTVDNYNEKMARAYVKHGGDIVAAWKDVYPPGGGGSMDGRYKTAKTIKPRFAEAYGCNKAFWLRVAELQREVDKQLAVTAADVLKHWETVALADRRALVSIEHQAAPCKHCGSVGCPECPPPVPVVVIAPTSSYGPAEVAVYEGAEQTKNGIKINMASKSEAWNNLARHFGLLNEKLLLARAGELKPDLPPLPDDPTEASKVYAQFIQGL